ncbi:hypothetical protein IMSAGC022_00132 [Alistipes sp.]|nr:hypothetical protein IMSAGC022_00132 [Alistipes sp.]
MALINCPECDSIISDKAPACSKCGVTINPAAQQPATQPRMPAISARTAVGITVAVIALMYGLINTPWLVLLGDYPQYMRINMSYYGIAAAAATFAAAGFALTKQRLATLLSIVAAMGASVAACFAFKNNIVFDAPTGDMPDYKILYAPLTVYLLSGIAVAAICAIGLADRNIPDRSEPAATTSWLSVAGIALCALLVESYSTVWCEVTMHGSATPLTGTSYILSSVAVGAMWVAMFGVCIERWLITGILAAANMLYGIYTLATDGLSGTYQALYSDSIASETVFSGVFTTIVLAALLLTLSLVAGRCRSAAVKA